MRTVEGDNIVFASAKEWSVLDRKGECSPSTASGGIACRGIAAYMSRPIPVQGMSLPQPQPESSVPLPVRCSKRLPP